MSRARGWKPFPHPRTGIDYAVAALKREWPRLHRGDREPFPGPRQLAQLFKDNPGAETSVPRFDGNFEKLSARALEGWRLYHRGDFEQAAALRAELGLAAFTLAAKATLACATYLAEGQEPLRLLERLVSDAEHAMNAWPQHANAHYFYAVALGRHSQHSSILEALARGIAGKVKTALDRTLELAPEHAEAHVALGSYHAAIVAQVGSMLAGITYGASSDAAIRHYEKALVLHPQSAIARVEYAKGLLDMFGRTRRDRALHLYEEATKIVPRDAMERLDLELARAQIARLNDCR